MIHAYKVGRYKKAKGIQAISQEQMRDLLNVCIWDCLAKCLIATASLPLHKDNKIAVVESIWGGLMLVCRSTHCHRDLAKLAWHMTLGLGFSAASNAMQNMRSKEGIG